MFRDMLLCADGAFWKFWPFSSGRGGSGFWDWGPAAAAKGVFVFILLVAVVLLLRKLFGPGGCLRESWIDEENRDKNDRGENS